MRDNMRFVAKKIGDLIMILIVTLMPIIAGINIMINNSNMIGGGFVAVLGVLATVGVYDDYKNKPDDRE